jgi:Actinobacteria/chloroflexi VLRF1 release factor
VKAAGSAADDVARVLVPRLSTLDGVVLGGERRAVDALRDDPRLAPVFARAVPRFLTTPDPKLAVLKGTPAMFRSVHIRLVDP